MLKQRTKFAGIRGASIADKLDFHTCPEPNSGCWLWLGTWQPGGYGVISIKKKAFFAHRLSWERHNGPIPKGLCVLHKCDVRCCINPDHLFLGNHKDNMQDAKRKGRTMWGEKNSRAKLTEAQVLDILADKRPPYHICRDYGVTSTTIYDIKKGINWAYLQRNQP